MSGCLMLRPFSRDSRGVLVLNASEPGDRRPHARAVPDGLFPALGIVLALMLSEAVAVQCISSNGVPR